ncbi:MAG: hypothetical protein JW839_04685, partial [Candidatus Lokiarchaeota archaeon]|nr:hypothetical protein [Candidatus Lokiarchaeota archaeon]
MADPRHRSPRLVGSLLLAAALAGAFISSLVHPASDGHGGASFSRGTRLVDSAPPSINQPPDRRVLLNDAGVVITWIITDPENASGTYIVAHDDFDPMENIASLPSMLRTWVNDTAFDVPVDTSQAGAHNYTILFSDMTQSELIEAAIAGDPISWGTDTVWVTVETPPVIQAPATLRIHEGETGRVLDFSIVDPDSPTGFMNVTMNGSAVLPANTQWNASQVVSLPLNTTSSGFQNYTLVATDRNYTVNMCTTVWVAIDFPPEILGLVNRTVSP